MFSLKFNKSDYRLIAIFAVLMAVWLVLKFWTENHPISQILFDVPVIILKTLAALFILRWLAQKFMIERQQYVSFIILGVLALIVTGFLDMMRDYYGSGKSWKDMPSIGSILIRSFYYSSADLSMPFLIIMAKKYFENQAQLAQVQAQQKESELKLLRAQLSPHFLFNNLNTVDALIDTDPEKAKIYIKKLSSLYRYLISSKDDDVVSLDAEINMVQDYFYLIKTRFGSAYTFEIKPNKVDYNSVYLPSGALQTLIENVVKHNTISHDESIHTELRISNSAVTMINNKSVTSVKEPTSLGTGIKNLNERYVLLSDQSVELKSSNTSFSVTLPLVQLNTTKD